MIVKMKFITITGPKHDIDRVINDYLSKYEIQLENALSELKTVDNLQPFTETNPYKKALEEADRFPGLLTQKKEDNLPELTPDQALRTISQAGKIFEDFQAKKGALELEEKNLTERMKMIEPFRPMQFVLREVFHYQFVKFRFGRVPLEYFDKMLEFIRQNPDVIFVEGVQNNSYGYGVYFTSRSKSEQIDAIFKSLHFERIFIPDEFVGTPEEAFADLEKKLKILTAEKEKLNGKMAAALNECSDKIYAARELIATLSANFDVRKMAACVEDKHENFYIICGWMSEEDVKNFSEDIKNDRRLFLMVEDEHEDYFGEPPTKLRNPKVLKPFEMFVKMYGLPSHNEIDPTIFIAMTYPLIFGIMFGDLGQGLCLFAGGLLLYLMKKVDLAGIIAAAGICSAFFGWMYGSFFGFENVIQARWLKPQEAMMNVPGIGKMNTVFVAAIVFGMFLILLTMILHIVFSARSGNLGESLFGASGAAGLVFYGSAVLAIFLFATGRRLPGAVILTVMFGIPLLLIALKEPLSALAKKHKPKMQEGRLMFLVQAFFELFETLLSYFSNTLSFVRIGAFAVSHGAMMGVVMMLSGAEAGHINWAVIVFGNLFVCLMEGLIVGIQVLRLEYYEIFSRFYQGGGKEFKPYRHRKKQDITDQRRSSL